MVLHFEEAKEDRTRDKKDCAMYEGLLRKISSTEFILDLGLMCATVLDFRTWPTGAKENILFGEEKICELSKRFNLNQRELICTFREFVKSPDVMPEKLLHLKNTLHIIPVSSSECERGFSQMNIVVTPDRAAILTETIKTNQLRTFNYVETWLLRGHHSAIDTNSKSRTKDEEEN
ncbi:hypothetical protein PR048_009583 [Dryococelus australis]|uniref:HAT C-terminal dimerisation domain-containing protein n=1 Tax=Dryococelus australis TaxID=614101 RepID=A0ABQ9I119_9NEOP|nr:hypothetical protein PR048_009583 [Dryococelus australis]